MRVDSAIVTWAVIAIPRGIAVPGVIAVPEGTVVLEATGVPEGIASEIGVFLVVDPEIRAHLAGAEDQTGEAHGVAARVAPPAWAGRAAVAADLEAAVVAAVDDDFIRV